ncbi:MAG: hypothetical protein FJ392_02325 [Verrucomicrobia bacterium]|nr:hypothetical protein [Verrucomicrobiota bacterium]
MSPQPPALPPKLLSRADAQVCFWSNLSMPGLGSWRAGWRLSGALQLALAGCALVLALAWFAWFLSEWARAGKLPMLVLMENDGRLPADWLKYLLLGLGSLILFSIAMGWALITSLCVRAEALRHEPR